MPNEVSKPAFVNLFKGESEETVRLSMGFTVFAVNRRVVFALVSVTMRVAPGLISLLTAGAVHDKVYGCPLRPQESRQNLCRRPGRTR